MKLVNRFTLWYLCITFTCTLVGSAITFYQVKKRLDNASVESLQHINDKVAARLQYTSRVEQYVHGRRVEIEQVDRLPGAHVETSRVYLLDPDTKKQETRLDVHSYYTINGKYYRISSFDFVTRSEEILAGLEASAVWKWLWILCVIGVSARLVSGYILSPFHRTMKAMAQFSLKKKARLELPETRTREFVELNRFVKNLTDKAREDYTSLKEFAENASHELQTPVAVIRGKLELLAESGLKEEQAIHLSAIQASLEKLSRINSSLVLLTRLENNEFAAEGPVSISELVNEAAVTYSELAQMKNLRLQCKSATGVTVQLHPLLADMLLNNLISNALRHNSPDGEVTILLTPHQLEIRNTGPAPQVPVQELFKRFKKSRQCANSVGLGLAIVKQICDQNGFAVHYTYTGQHHVLTVVFRPGQEDDDSFPQPPGSPAATLHQPA
jgi:two-component system sensor histidine kinase QseC